MDILYSNVKERNGIWSETAQELFEIQSFRKFYEKKEKEVTERLKYLSEGESSRDNIFAYIKEYRNGSIDYGAIELLKTIDVEQYRKAPIQTWKLAKI